MTTQYRTRTDPPTKPGLYWARDSAWESWMPIPSSYIVPVEFWNPKECYIIGTEQHFSVDDFHWFGPVDPVREG